METKLIYSKYSNSLSQNLTIKSIENNNVLIEGYATVFNIPDAHNDVIIKGTFNKISSNNIKLLWQHNSDMPIGIVNSLIEDDYGLKITATINNRIQCGLEAIELISSGALDGLSIGFYIKLSQYNKLGERIIQKAELVEISIVTFPANKHAKISYVRNHKKDNNMDTELITKEIDNMNIKMNLFTEKMNMMDTILTRPDAPDSARHECKTDFNNYIRTGNQLNLMQKSLSSSEDEAGVIVVPSLYNNIITQINARSPMRQLSSCDTISTNALDIIIENGSFAGGWIGETENRDTTVTPKLIQHRIFVHELYAQPKASQALLNDSALPIENWLIDKLQDSFVRAENEAFIHGDGKKKPKGILSKDHKKIDIMEMKENITASKLLDMISMLDEEYLHNATFMMNRRTLAEVQKLQDGNGRFIWQQSISESLKQTIFGIPVVCCAHLDSITNNSIFIVLADFKSAYKIVDRANINIMRDPYTDKPFVKFYAVKRVGGDVINQNAIKFAKFIAA
jgi:HK97 family phage major capsid protein